MPAKTDTGIAGRNRALWMSTIAFTVCFAVWTIFAIIGVQIKRDLGLNETQFGLLVGTPILSGSLIRIALGVWTDQYGGRIVYTAVVATAVSLSFAILAASYVALSVAMKTRRDGEIDQPKKRAKPRSSDALGMSAFGH